MLQEWDSAARKAIRKRQAFNAGAPGVQGFSPSNPPRFAPSAQGCMNIACICPYMGVCLNVTFIFTTWHLFSTSCLVCLGSKNITLIPKLLKFVQAILKINLSLILLLSKLVPK